MYTFVKTNKLELNLSFEIVLNLKHSVCFPLSLFHCFMGFIVTTKHTKDENHSIRPIQFELLWSSLSLKLFLKKIFISEKNPINGVLHSGFS